MGPEAHPDPKRRYIAPVAAGVFYLLIGLGGGAVVGLMAAFPHALVVAVAGLALLGTIAGALSSALAVEKHRDAAAHHLPRHAVGRDAGRHRRAVLGRRGRRASRWVCNTSGLPRRPRAEKPCRRDVGARRAIISCRSLASRTRSSASTFPARASRAGARHPGVSMKLLFVADPLDTFKIYKDSTFAMMREASQARPHAVGHAAGRPELAARRPRAGARAADHADRRRQPRPRALVHDHRRRDRRRRRVRRRADAQGSAVRQRVLLRDAPADARRARRRAGAQLAGGAARASREARHPRVPAVHRADARHALGRRRARASTRSIATSSSSRSTAWAAPASSA